MNQRITRLEDRIQAYSGAIKPTVFILEGGGTFSTSMDPLEYLVKNGMSTLYGRIISYPYPVEGVDALSLALYAQINDEIQTQALRQIVEELDSDD